MAGNSSFYFKYFGDWDFYLKVLFLEPLIINIKQQIPGPGSYQPKIGIDKYGKYVLSKIQNSRAANWSPSKKRFIDENRHKRDIPGPGNYNPSDYSGGQYLLSTNKNLGSIKIKEASLKKA